MNASTLPDLPHADPHFELRFEPLASEGRGCAFVCDDRGRVDLDALSEPARLAYFYARALVGRDFAKPAVRPLH